MALVLSSVFGLSITSKAANNKVQYLLEKGIPEEIVSNMSELTIQQVYDMLYGENRVLLSVESTEMQEEQLTRDIVDPEKMDLTIIAAADVTTIGEQKRIDEVLVMVCTTWYEQPICKWTDKVAVNWDGSVFTYEANSFDITCYAFHTDYSRSAYYESETLGALTQGGLGYDVPLSYNSRDCILESLASFILLPANGPIYQENGYSSTNINANYTHDGNLLSKYFQFSISGMFVSVTPEGEYDTVAAGANVNYKK